MHVERWLEAPVEELSPSIGRQVVHTETMTIARIRLAAGARVPRHEHPHEQVANVLAGRLRFVVGDDEREVAEGESVFVPGGVPHQVEALVDSVVLDVFSPVRDDWVRGEDAYLRG
jgi:quercetin dioxygenase-like cupin family protein